MFIDLNHMSDTVQMTLPVTPNFSCAMTHLDPAHLTCSFG